jgi:UTP--glucose-1-phosphate uridylyltransferase
MLPMVDKPIVHHAVEEAVSAGIEEIIFVISPNNQPIVDYFTLSSELEAVVSKSDRSGGLASLQRIIDHVKFRSTKAQPWRGLPGLGSAILTVQNLVEDEPFAVVLPNDLIISPEPCLKSLLQIYSALQTAVIAIHRVTEREIPTYGNVTPVIASAREANEAGVPNDRLYKVTQLIQRPSVAQRLSDMAIIGRYILPPEIFEVLHDTEPGFGGELQLTDAMESLLERGTKILGYEFEGQYLDTREKVGYVKAFIEFAKRDPELVSIFT